MLGVMLHALQGAARVPQRRLGNAACRGLGGRPLVPRRLCWRRRASPSCQAAEAATQAAAVPQEGCTSVTFTVCHRVAFGQVLKVVGSTAVLGSWDCTAAPVMDWSDGDNWSLTVDLPAGQHEFKMVVDSQGGGYDWESGNNRVVAVPDPLASANSEGAFSVVCQWSQTETMLATPPDGSVYSVEGSLDLGAPTDSDEGEPWLEDMAGEPSGAPNDEGEAVVLEGAAAPKRSGEVATDSDQGEGWVEDMAGEPAPGALSSSEREPPVEVGKITVGKMTMEGQPQEVGKMTVGKMTVEGQPEEVGKMTVGKMSMDQAQEVPAGAATSADAERSTAASEGQSAEAGEPSQGTQVAAATLGLLALPVVAWSEYTLHSTGCGLPPGPSGLLGAAEGVSYLAVGGLVLWSLGRKISTGRGLPAGPGGLLGAVEGGSWLAVASGLVVLALQYQAYGYIPSALPDSNCFGPGAPDRGAPAVQLPDFGRQLAALRERLPSAQQLDAQLESSLSAVKGALPSTQQVESQIESSLGALRQALPSAQQVESQLELSLGALRQALPSAQQLDAGVQELNRRLSGEMRVEESTQRLLPKIVVPPQQPASSYLAPLAAAPPLVDDASSGSGAAIVPPAVGQRPQQGLQYQPYTGSLHFTVVTAGVGVGSSGVAPAVWVPAGPAAAPLAVVALQPDAAGALGGSGGSGYAQLELELPLRAQQQGEEGRLARLQSRLAAVREGIAALADPAAAAAAAEAQPPPLQKPVLEAVEKLRTTDVGPAVETVKRAFGDLRDGFAGLLGLDGEGGEQEARGAAAAPAAEGQEDGGAAAAAAAAERAAREGRGRPGDALRDAIDSLAPHEKVLGAASEMGKRTSSLLQRAGDAAEALVRAQSGQELEGEQPAAAEDAGEDEGAAAAAAAVAVEVEADGAADPVADPVPQ